MKQKETLLRVGKLLRPYGGYIGGILIFAIITVVATLYSPVLIGQGVDDLIGQGMVNFTGLWKKMLILGSFIGIAAFSQWLVSFLTNRVSYKIVQNLRKSVFHQMENLPIAYLDSHQPGDVISRISSDIDQFSDGLLMGFTQFFTGTLTILGTLGFMISLDGKISILVVLLTPVSFLAAGFVAKRTYQMFRAQSEVRGKLTSLVEELVGNQKLVQSFSYEKRSCERFYEFNHKMEGCGLKATFFSSITNPVTRFVNGLVYTGVGILGAFSVISGRITVGQLTSFLTYANQYTKPFNEISGVITELQNAMACGGRIFQFLEEKTLPKEEDKQYLEQVRGEIVFQKVHFSYDTDKPFIQNLDFVIHAGERVAVVGPTGCGKTTMINLLMGYYECNQGEILIDGIPITEINRESLRKSCGLVLQDTWLKAGTIWENIAYGSPDASREEIIEAAKASYAHGFIKRLPQGYDTVIGEDGGNLSAGQKQLLCIARVMLQKPPVLILDEATSSIDTMTEQRVQKAFDRLMEGRTSFVVAHRLSTIQEADKILVMKDGQIMESGTHEKLLENKGLYETLYHSQFSSQ